MDDMYTYTLKSGLKLPAIAMGTDFTGVATSVKAAIATALDLGYSLIDTATGYGTHKDVAEALEGRDRSTISICTKFHNGDLMEAGGDVTKVVETILNDLSLEGDERYLDVLLLHNPKVADWPRVITALEELKGKGVLKAIGVSNFTLRHLHVLQEAGLLEHVDVNQIECHPYLVQSALLAFCKENGIHVMAYRPFAQAEHGLLTDGVIKAIADKHGKPAAQICLRWGVQNGFTVIPRSSSPEHITANLAVFDFELSEDEMGAITALNKGIRTCTGPWAEFGDDTVKDSLYE